MDVAADPVGQRLGGEGLGIGVAAGAQDGHEEFGLPHLAGVGVDDRQGHAGEVHERLLAGAVLLAHDQVEATLPATIGLAEPGVAEALGVTLAVFEPEQLAGHALAAQLLVDRGPVGHGPQLRRWPGRDGHEQARLERGIVEVIGQWPVEPGEPSAGEVVADRRTGHPGGGRDLTAGEALAQGEAEQLTDLAHGGTGAWHRFRPRTDGSSEPRWRSPGVLTSALARPRVRVAGNPWDHWPDRRGTSGRIAVESAARRP